MNPHDPFYDLKLHTLRRKVRLIGELSVTEKGLLVRLIDLELEEISSHRSCALPALERPTPKGSSHVSFNPPSGGV